jgi:hypothetical protein
LIHGANKKDKYKRASVVEEVLFEEVCFRYSNYIKNVKSMTRPKFNNKWNNMVLSKLPRWNNI